MRETETEKEELRRDDLRKKRGGCEGLYSIWGRKKKKSLE